MSAYPEPAESEPTEFAAMEPGGSRRDDWAGAGPGAFGAGRPEAVAGEGTRSNAAAGDTTAFDLRSGAMGGVADPRHSGAPPAAGRVSPPQAAETESALRFARASAEPGGTMARGPRKANLVLTRVEPWSVMKFSFVMSLVCFIVLFVAVLVLYGVLAGLGVFDALTSTIRDLTAPGDGSSGGLDPASWFSASRLLGYTALIGAANVILITALSTVGAVLYNLAADLVGGVEVTLRERG